MVPARDVSPTVGFIPTKALRSAGLITLPSVSVPVEQSEPDQDRKGAHQTNLPSENVTMFAATAAALPELLPPGFTVRL